MTLEETNITEEELMEVRDRSLKEAYVPHDVAQDILVARLQAHGFTVVDHGDDARHADEVFFGDGPDHAIYHCPESAVDEHEPLCYIEVKSKESEEWFGRCNKRHFNEYVAQADEVDCPVFLWFALVDADANTVHREAFVEVEDVGQIEGRVTDLGNREVVFYDEDAYEVDDGLLAVDAKDIIGVRGDDLVVDGFPNIHGNDVVELNDDTFRSFPHFLHCVRG